MANVNPGPAVTGTQNSVLTTTPVNTQTNSNPQESNQIRCLAYARAVSVNATGDVAAMPVLNASRWNITNVIVSNMGVNPGTSVAIEINTSQLGAGTTIVAPVVLSSLQAFGGVTVAYRPVVINTTYAGTQQTLYVNCQTTAGTACTLDVFVYGYDLS